MKHLLFVCGQGWIRTTEAMTQQIYSLPHLATLEPTQNQYGWCKGSHFWRIRKHGWAIFLRFIRFFVILPSYCMRNDTQ